MGASAPDSVKRLVDRFDQGRKVLLSSDYKEEQLRAEFLTPLLESLGWDVYNRAGLPETFKQVIHEESIKVAGTTEAPDYTFRIGGRHNTGLTPVSSPAITHPYGRCPALGAKEGILTYQTPSPRQTEC